MHFIGHAIESVLLAAALWVAVQVPVYVFTIGSIGSVNKLSKIRKFILTVPLGTQFVCVNDTVSVVYHNYRMNEERAEELWHYTQPTLLTWSNKQRLSKHDVKHRINREIWWRSALAVGVLAPSIFATLWLAFADRWVWILATIFIVMHQIYCWIGGRLLIIGWPLVSGAAVSFLGHWTIWGTLTVTEVVVITWAQAMLGLTMLAVVHWLDSDSDLSIST